MLPTRLLVAYAALALPLAMAALPVYLHVPALYAGSQGLAMGTVGAILLATRALDAVQDPLLGWWSDRRAAVGRGRAALVVLGALLLGLGMLALFRPPGGDPFLQGAWLAGSLCLTYLGLSLASIAYLALGTDLTADVHQRTRLAGARATVGLGGVVLASALPGLLGGEAGTASGLARFALVFVPVLVAGVAVVVFGVPEPARTGLAAPRSVSSAVLAPWREARFRWLVVVFVASGVAGAIPATLMLFYVQDVLGRPDLLPVFLGLYFLAGAAGMPLWVWAARRHGKAQAWMAAMVLAMAAFVWASSLGAGDAVAYGVVCTLSGLAYGAELALPPSLLADVAGERGEGGAFFGYWQATEKLNLALAAGIALPLLGASGYRPGLAQPAGGDLSLLYALLPCAIKAMALGLLWFSPLTRGPGAPGPITETPA